MHGGISNPCLGPKSLLGSLSTAIKHTAPYIKFLLTDILAQIIKSLAKNSTKQLH